MALTYLERSRPTRRGCTGACWEPRSPGRGQSAPPWSPRTSAHPSARKRVRRRSGRRRHRRVRRWRKTATHLVLQDKDEDVVRSDGEHEERHHLEDDQRGGDADPGVEAHGGEDGAAHHQDAAQAHQELGVHLRANTSGAFSPGGNGHRPIGCCVISPALRVSVASKATASAAEISSIQMKQLNCCSFPYRTFNKSCFIKYVRIFECAVCVCVCMYGKTCIDL